MNAANRRDRRVLCFAQGTLQGPKGAVRGIFRNLSPGGAFLASNDPLPVGQSVDVEIELPGHCRPVRARGEVGHVASRRDAQGMGIRFWRMSDEDLTTLNAYLNNQSPLAA